MLLIATGKNNTAGSRIEPGIWTLSPSFDILYITQGMTTLNNNSNCLSYPWETCIGAVTVWDMSYTNFWLCGTTISSSHTKIDCRFAVTNDGASSESVERSFFCIKGVENMHAKHNDYDAPELIKGLIYMAHTNWRHWRLIQRKISDSFRWRREQFGKVWNLSWILIFSTILWVSLCQFRRRRIIVTINK